jgi:hypothetical protein
MAVSASLAVSLKPAKALNGRWKRYNVVGPRPFLAAFSDALYENTKILQKLNFFIQISLYILQS